MKHLEIKATLRLHVNPAVTSREQIQEILCACHRLKRPTLILTDALKEYIGEVSCEPKYISSIERVELWTDTDNYDVDDGGEDALVAIKSTMKVFFIDNILNNESLKDVAEDIWIELFSDLNRYTQAFIEAGVEITILEQFQNTTQIENISDHIKEMDLFHTLDLKDLDTEAKTVETTYKTVETTLVYQ